MSNASDLVAAATVAVAIAAASGADAAPAVSDTTSTQRSTPAEVRLKFNSLQVISDHVVTCSGILMAGGMGLAKKDGVPLDPKNHFFMAALERHRANAMLSVDKTGALAIHANGFSGSADARALGRDIVGGEFVIVDLQNQEIIFSPKPNTVTLYGIGLDEDNSASYTTEIHLAKGAGPAPV